MINDSNGDKQMTLHDDFNLSRRSKSIKTNSSIDGSFEKDKYCEKLHLQFIYVSTKNNNNKNEGNKKNDKNNKNNENNNSYGKINDKVKRRVHDYIRFAMEKNKNNIKNNRIKNNIINDEINKNIINDKIYNNIINNKIYKKKIKVKNNIKKLKAGKENKKMNNINNSKKINNKNVINNYIKNGNVIMNNNLENENDNINNKNNNLNNSNINNYSSEFFGKRTKRLTAKLESISFLQRMYVAHNSSLLGSFIAPPIRELSTGLLKNITKKHSEFSIKVFRWKQNSILVEKMLQKILEKAEKKVKKSKTDSNFLEAQLIDEAEGTTAAKINNKKVHVFKKIKTLLSFQKPARHDEPKNHTNINHVSHPAMNFGALYFKMFDNKKVLFLPKTVLIFNKKTKRIISPNIDSTLPVGNCNISNSTLILKNTTSSTNSINKSSTKNQKTSRSVNKNNNSSIINIKNFSTINTAINVTTSKTTSTTSNVISMPTTDIIASNNATTTTKTTYTTPTLNNITTTFTTTTKPPTNKNKTTTPINNDATSTNNNIYTPTSTSNPTTTTTTLTPTTLTPTTLTPTTTTTTTLTFISTATTNDTTTTTHKLNTRSTNMVKRKTALLSSGTFLECDDNNSSGNFFEYSDKVIAWRKLSHKSPIFLQYDGFIPHIPPSYQVRIFTRCVCTYTHT